MKDLIKRPEGLPDTVDKLQNFILIGKQRLIACKAEIKAIEDVNLSKAVKDQKLHETQDLASILLIAEAKLGELLRPLPHGKGLGKGKGSEKSLPEGMTWKQSHYAQQLAANPGVIEEVINDATKRLEIPRRSDAFRKINARKRKKEQSEIIIPEGKYQVIYADPPWPVDSMILEKWDSPLDDKYPTMTVDEIKYMGLKVSRHTADDCSLFLWTTHTFLKEAFSVIESWGFKYHCCITWDKGSGWSLCGFHRRTEFCLYAYKGKINVNQTGEFIPTLISEPKRKHSEKPEIMYKLIENHAPSSRLELFARNEREGWVSWGNQI